MPRAAAAYERNGRSDMVPFDRDSRLTVVRAQCAALRRQHARVQEQVRLSVVNHGQTFDCPRATGRIQPNALEGHLQHAEQPDRIPVGDA